MSAAPEDRLEQEPNRWPVPPEGGWTADDLDRIPGLPPHTELIDGSLVFMSPQRKFHTRAMWLLESALLAHVPADLDVDREMTIRLDTSNRPEPDLLVYRADADTGPDQTWYAPEDVVLAVEVVSPDSLERDRGVKPRKYAEAGSSTSGGSSRATTICRSSTSTNSTRRRAPTPPPESTTRR